MLYYVLLYCDIRIYMSNVVNLYRHKKGFQHFKLRARDGALLSGGERLAPTEAERRPEVHSLSQIRINKGGKRTTQRVSTKWVQKLYPRLYTLCCFIFFQKTLNISSIHGIISLYNRKESGCKFPIIAL